MKVMLDPAVERLAICKATDAIIERSGVSGYELARRAEIAEASVSKYRSGKMEPSAVAIAKIEIAVGASRGSIYAEASRELATVRRVAS